VSKKSCDAHNPIKIYRNPESLVFLRFREEYVCFQGFFLLPELQTVKVTGSNPVSPTTPFPIHPQFSPPDSPGGAGEG